MSYGATSAVPTYIVHNIILFPSIHRYYMICNNLNENTFVLEIVECIKQNE